MEAMKFAKMMPYGRGGDEGEATALREGVQRKTKVYIDAS